MHISETDNRTLLFKGQIVLTHKEAEARIFSLPVPVCLLKIKVGMKEEMKCWISAHNEGRDKGG